MQKVISKKIDKIWGYEIWLHSTVQGQETKLENGEKTFRGPLVKIIQANMPLSVQVHPDDEFAMELEKQPNGKSESWFILESKPSSKIVTGLKNYDPEFIRAKLEDGTFENNLLKAKAEPGDFFDIPAGLVHGIGADIKLLEVQQPSDVTYRYFDYNRLENGKPRELHVEKALKVQKDLDYKLEPVSKEPLTFKNIVGTQRYFKKPMKLEEDSIIVDIEKEEAYVANAGEEVSFNWYCVISMD